MCNSDGVPPTTPGPTVHIVEPKDGATYKTTAAVPLQATATDKFDGAITSPLQTHWTRDMTDPTGEGLQDAIDPKKDPPLTVGMHSITFAAVDSKCLVGFETVNIVVTK